MKGQRYVPTDFGGPATTSTTSDTIAAGETRIIRAEPVVERAPEVTAEPAPTYVARQPARKKNNALWAIPLGLAALTGGVLWAASSNDDEVDTAETVAAVDAGDSGAATTTTTTVTETAAAAPVEAAPIETAAAAPAARTITTASAPRPAAVTRVQRTEARTAVARATPRAPVAEASSAGAIGVDASGPAVDLTSEAAGSGELPAGPQPYSAIAPSPPATQIQEPAPVDVEPAPVNETPPLAGAEVTPVAP